MSTKNTGDSDENTNTQSDSKEKNAEGKSIKQGIEKDDKSIDDESYAKFNLTDPIDILSLALQCVSLVTTVEGIAFLFPTVLVLNAIPLSWFLGGTIQGIVIILLLFGHKNESSIRKASLITVCTLFSIYSSFFSIYINLSGGKDKIEIQTRIRSQESLKKLQEDVNPVAVKILELEASINKLKDDQKREEAGLRFGEEGRGFLYKKLEQDISDKRDVLDKIKPSFVELSKQIKIAEKANIDKDPQKVCEAINFAYSQVKGEPFNIKYEFDIRQCLNNESLFLIPFNRILNDKDQKALVAVIIAIFVDLVSIILGSMRHPINFWDKSSIPREIMNTILRLKEKEKDGQTLGEGSKLLVEIFDEVSVLKNWEIDIEKFIEKTNDQTKAERSAYKILLSYMRIQNHWLQEDSQGSSVKNWKKILSGANQTNGNPEDPPKNYWKIKDQKAFYDWFVKELRLQMRIEQGGKAQARVSLIFVINNLSKFILKLFKSESNSTYQK